MVSFILPFSEPSARLPRIPAGSSVWLSTLLWCDPFWSLWLSCDGGSHHSPPSSYFIFCFLPSRCLTWTSGKLLSLLGPTKGPPSTVEQRLDSLTSLPSIHYSALSSCPILLSSFSSGTDVFLRAAFLSTTAFEFVLASECKSFQAVGVNDFYSLLFSVLASKRPQPPRAQASSSATAHYRAAFSSQCILVPEAP